MTWVVGRAAKRATGRDGVAGGHRHGSFGQARDESIRDRAVSRQLVQEAGGASDRVVVGAEDGAAVHIAKVTVRGRRGASALGSHTLGVDVVYECGRGRKRPATIYDLPYARFHDPAHTRVLDHRRRNRPWRTDRSVDTDELTGFDGYRSSSGRRSADSSAWLGSLSPTGIATTTTRRSLTPTTAGPPSGSLSAGDHRVRSSS